MLHSTNKASITGTQGSFKLPASFSRTARQRPAPGTPRRDQRSQQRSARGASVRAAAVPGPQQSGLLQVVAEPVPIAAHPPSVGMSGAAAALAAGAAVLAAGRFLTADADMALLLRWPGPGSGDCLASDRQLRGSAPRSDPSPPRIPHPPLPSPRRAARRGAHRRGAFDGKVIWITGASQGLGLVLASYLASQGARLILSSRSLEKLQVGGCTCCYE